MTLSTQSIIKLLDIDPEEKLTVIEQYNAASSLDKLKMADKAWDAFDSMYDDLVQQKMEGLVKPAMTEEEVTKIRLSAMEETEKELMNKLTDSSDTTDIAAARKAIEQIMFDINAAKKAKKLIH